MVIYTDGSYKPLKNEYTYAFVVVNNEVVTYKFKNTEKISKDQKTKKYSSTIAELKAIMMAVKHAKEKKEYAIIYSDFKTVNQIILQNKSYRLNFINYFKKYMRANEGAYEIKHVKGHSTNKYNNFVDEICSNRMCRVEKVVGCRHYIYNICN